MVYFLNTEISEHKKTEVAIQQIFGIGKNRSVQICKQIGLTKNSSIKSLSNETKTKLIQYIEKNIENGEDLRQRLTQIKEHKIKIKCYKGQRSKLKLPRRGQRTHTNAKTTKKL